MTTIIHRIETEQDRIKLVYKPSWTPEKGLAPSYVRLLDAMLLAPNLKVLAANLKLSEHTVTSQLKIISRRYKLHKQSDIVMWWALWLACYATKETKSKPLMPHQMWPFSERKLK